MEQVIQLNSSAKLSEHFTLGELTKTSHKVYNIPSHEAIENLKRLCTWLEYLRKRYNELNVVGDLQSPTDCSGDLKSPKQCGRIANAPEHPIIINSGYRSPQLNRKIGGQPNSNHLTGCAVDIRVKDNEQLIQYAAILIQYANDTHQDFDELLLEKRSASPLGSSKNRHGAIWLHFAVRPKENRRKILFLTA